MRTPAGSGSRGDRWGGTGTSAPTLHLIPPATRGHTVPQVGQGGRGDGPSGESMAVRPGAAVCGVTDAALLDGRSHWRFETHRPIRAIPPCGSSAGPSDGHTCDASLSSRCCRRAERSDRHITMVARLQRLTLARLTAQACPRGCDRFGTPPNHPGLTSPITSVAVPPREHLGAAAVHPTFCVTSQARFCRSDGQGWEEGC